MLSLGNMTPESNRPGERRTISFSLAPAQMSVIDDKGRRWLPVFLPGRTVRQGRPTAADKPRCYGLARAETGKTIAMAETLPDATW